MENSLANERGASRRLLIKADSRWTASTKFQCSEKARFHVGQPGCRTFNDASLAEYFNFVRKLPSNADTTLFYSFPLFLSLYLSLYLSLSLSFPILRPFSSFIACRATTTIIRDTNRPTCDLSLETYLHVFSFYLTLFHCYPEPLRVPFRLQLRGFLRIFFIHCNLSFIVIYRLSPYGTGQLAIHVVFSFIATLPVLIP